LAENSVATFARKEGASEHGGERSEQGPKGVVAARPSSARRSMFGGSLAVQGGRMIRKLKWGEYRLYSKKTDAKTGKRRNLGTFATREEAMKHERAVQYFKRRG
jgi:hypothetical protein